MWHPNRQLEIMSLAQFRKIFGAALPDLVCDMIFAAVTQKQYVEFADERIIVYAEDIRNRPRESKEEMTDLLKIVSSDTRIVVTTREMRTRPFHWVQFVAGDAFEKWRAGIESDRFDYSPVIHINTITAHADCFGV